MGSVRLLPPKRHTKEQLKAWSINILAGHIKSHEEYARQCLNANSYKRYYEEYLSEAYAIGNNKDFEGFSLELLISGVDKIPFKWKMPKDQWEPRPIPVKQVDQTTKQENNPHSFKYAQYIKDIK